MRLSGRLVVLSVAAVLSVALAGCSSTSLRLVTHDRPEQSGMEALLRAQLAASEDGCVYAQTDGGAVTLIWPKGYAVSGDQDSFTVRDADGTAVARSGTDLDIGGGGVDTVDDGWSEKSCATGTLWMVGQVGSASGTP